MTPIVAPTTAEAVKIYDQLNSFIQLDAEDTPEEHRRYGALGGRGKRNLSNVTRVIEVDVRGRAPDEAVDPRVLKEANEEGQRLFAQISERTRRDVTGANRITYRDLIIAAAGQGGGVVGDPVEVADYIQDWFEKEACDGFNIFPSYNPTRSAPSPIWSCRCCRTAASTAATIRDRPSATISARRVRPTP